MTAVNQDENTTLRRDLLLTYLVTGCVTLGSLALFRLAIEFLGEDGFSLFALFKRISGPLQPVMMMGMGIALPRFVSMAKNELIQLRLFSSALCSALIASLIVSFLCWAFQNQLSIILFGSPEQSKLLPYIGITIGGQVINGLCYSYYRGALKIYRLAIIKVVSVVIIPIAALSLSTGSVIYFFRIYALLLALNAIAIILLAGVSKVTTRERRTLVELAGSAQTLLSYGSRRVPGDIALMLLLALPSVIAVHIAELRLAGVVAFGTSFVTMFGVVFNPISTLMLPYLGRMFARNDSRSVIKIVLRVAGTAITVGMVVMVLAVALAGPIVELLLGDGYQDSVWIVRRMLIAGGLYGVFVSLRSVNDALDHRALNARASISALALFMVIVGFLSVTELSIGRVLVAFNIGVAAMTVLAAISALTLLKRSRTMVKST